MVIGPGGVLTLLYPFASAIVIHAESWSRWIGARRYSSWNEAREAVGDKLIHRGVCVHVLEVTHIVVAYVANLHNSPLADRALNSQVPLFRVRVMEARTNGHLLAQARIAANRVQR